MTSDFSEESSEGGSYTSSVQKLAESVTVIVETLNSASKGKSTGKGKKGQWAQDSSTGGHIAASRGRSLKKQEEPLKSPRGKAKAKAKVEERPKAKEKASDYVWRDWTPRKVVPERRMG